MSRISDQRAYMGYAMRNWDSREKKRITPYSKKIKSSRSVGRNYLSCYTDRPSHGVRMVGAPLASVAAHWIRRNAKRLGYQEFPF